MKDKAKMPNKSEARGKGTYMRRKRLNQTGPKGSRLTEKSKAPSNALQTTVSGATINAIRKYTLI